MAKWEKGVSGNPSGRPKKGQTITDLLRQKLNRERFVDALLELAYTKDLAAIKLILSYVDGLPSQAVEQTTEVMIKVEFDDNTLEEDDDLDSNPHITPSA